MKPDDDLPEITDDMPARAELRVDGKLIRRGGTRQQGRAHRLRADDEGRPIRRPTDCGLNERAIR